MWFVSCLGQTYVWLFSQPSWLHLWKKTQYASWKILQQPFPGGHAIWYNRFMLSLNFRFSVLLWPLAMLKWARMNLWQMSILLSISWSPFWRRTGRTCEHSISRVQWESLSVCIRALLCSGNKRAVKCRIVHHTWPVSSLKLLHYYF